MMTLSELYKEVKMRIDHIDFSLLWKDFQPRKFALYNDRECFFNGDYIQKTDQFLANTAIDYEGEYIAIWDIMEDHYDFDVLASKIIHEMFHGFQYENNESRFPDEIEALRQYIYSNNNLSIKMAENHLINQLNENFDLSKFNKLLQIRKKRMTEHPYEYVYEASIEQIEGSANYVELESLRQLSVEKYLKVLLNIRNDIIDISKQIPIRVISYSIGALLLQILRSNTSIDCDRFEDKSFAERMLTNIDSYPLDIDINEQIADTVSKYNDETNKLIASTLLTNKCVLKGKFKLNGVNVYNARYCNNYIISTYFVAYKKAEKDEILDGNFVIHLDDDGDIDKIYLLDEKPIEQHPLHNE
jgi:hypothetical protein